MFGLARASTVRLFVRDGQWWTRGNWITAIPWIVSLAAHLGFDYLAGGRGSGSTSFGNATILLYLAVTFTMQRLVVISRAQHRAIPGQAEATGLA